MIVQARVRFKPEVAAEITARCEATGLTVSEVVNAALYETWVGVIPVTPGELGHARRLPDPEPPPPARVSARILR